MTETEVKKRIKGIGTWREFCKWMRGQTIGLIDGKADYYDCDVEAFIKMKQTGYDRQKDPFNWD